MVVSLESWSRGPESEKGATDVADRARTDLVDREGTTDSRDTATEIVGRAGRAPSSVVTVIVTSEKPV